MDRALAAMLTETVQHATFVSRDAYGAPTYSVPVTRPARIEYRTRQITNRGGQEITSRGKVWLLPDQSVQHTDTLILPDGTAPAIQDIWPIDDVDGTLHHIEVFF